MIRSLGIISFLNGSELISLHTSIDIDSSQLNGLNYCSLIFIIQFNINRLFAEKIGNISI